VDNRESGHFLRSASIGYEVSERFYRSYLAGLPAKTLIAGIRPHSIRPLRTNEQASRTKTIAATVSLVENMGKDKYLYLDVSSERLVAKLSLEFAAEIGDAFEFTFEEEDVRLFDVNTGLSLMAGS
jgi:multiple sugar transport system ATP-binding protein